MNQIRQRNMQQTHTGQILLATKSCKEIGTSIWLPPVVSDAPTIEPLQTNTYRSNNTTNLRAHQTATQNQINKYEIHFSYIFQIF